MRRRLPLLLLAVAVGIALGWWFMRHPASSPAVPAPVSTQKLRPPPAPAPLPPAPSVPEPVRVATDAITPPPVVLPPAHPAVPIQDGKTIDFSSGRPVVKDSGAEKAIIEAAVKQMDEAAKNVHFSPTGPATADKVNQQKPAVPSGEKPAGG